MVKRLALGVGLLFALTKSSTLATAPLIVVSVSDYTTMYSPTERGTIGGDEGSLWFDGSLGTFSKSGPNYTAWGVLGGDIANTAIKTVGPITDIANIHTSINFSGCPSFAGYCSGGDVVSLDRGSTNLGMILHYERYPDGNESNYYATLGVAWSADGGASWTSGGTDMLTPFVPYSPSETSSVDIQNGSLVPVGPYYYLYFEEVTNNTLYPSVARCLMSAFNAALLAQTIPAFEKWQGGSTWGGSNLGANLSMLFDGESFPDVWYDSSSGLYLRVATDNIAGYDAHVQLWLSSDGLNWGSPTTLTTETNTVGQEGVIYANLIPTTITGNRSGFGPWTLIYMYGTRTASTEVRSRTLRFSERQSF